MAADGVDYLKLQLVHGPDRHDLYVPIPSTQKSGSAKHQLELRLPDAEAGDVLTVGHLSKAVAELTEVPEKNQRLIFKGRSLTQTDDSLSSLGVRQGSKIMLLGKKPGSLDAEDVKKLTMVEKDVAAHSKKVSDITYELDGIDKGFMDTTHIGSALQKITKRVKAESESFMKMLETLDSLRFEESNKGARIKRKNMADQIQRLLDRCDFLNQGVQHIRQKSSS